MIDQFTIRESYSFDSLSTLNPLLQRIYSAREINHLNQLDYSLSQLINPNLIYGLKEAADKVIEHHFKNSKILIVGDYDADGATSTALLIKGLNQLGLNNLSYILPDRVNEGYGLSEGIVIRILKEDPDLLITVDTGISSIQGIDTLRENNIEVLVTDHHLPADELPNAIILNPNAYSKELSLNGRNLAGVGVAFYLLLMMRSKLRSQSYFSKTIIEPNLALLLDLVALGTVADLVPLDHLNRVLVSQGIMLMQKQHCCLGIQKLFEVSGKDIKQACSTDLAFSIAPKINAAGRLENMALGVECLLSESSQVNHYALQLDDINQQRRSLQTDIEVDCEVLIHQLLQQQELPKGLVLMEEDWHEGVVGIVASKIKAKFYRPVFVFAKAADGSLKGSGRSIQGVHLRDVLDLMDKQNPQIIIKFGGHAMAAGLSINESQYSHFKNVFDKTLDDLYEDALFKQNYLTDGYLDSPEINLDNALLLQNSGPWGQKFDEPEFVGEFKVIQQKTLKQQHLKFVLQLEGSHLDTVDAIAFYCDENQLSNNYDLIKIIFRLNVNCFRGQQSVQLLINKIL